MDSKYYQENTPAFKVLSEQFADIRILRYQVPGFENLPVRKKELIWYLYEAALSGRDILWDQHYRYNLFIRHALENIVNTYTGDRASGDWTKFMIYTKRVWFSNGIHHHYSMDKILPDFQKEYFIHLAQKSNHSGFPAENGDLNAFLEKIIPLIFNSDIDPKRVVLDQDKDTVKASANNFYEQVTQKQAEEFYNKMVVPDDPEPVMVGLNSKLTYENGNLYEKVWKIDGMYGKAIEKIVFWLRKAIAVAENQRQKAAIEKLVEFYETGDLKKFDEYNILWLQDTASEVDVVNGFIEVYGDPLGRKATWESVVSIRDEEATKRAKTISDHAQWFEDNSPTRPEHKKQNVKGVSARGINVVVEAGDCSPSSPIGINLPNSEWIRTRYGSKSVTINNIMAAYDEVSKESGVIEEFAWSQDEIDLARKWGMLATNLHVDLHEIAGHGSGQINPGVGNPSETLKNYASTLEEARADLFALYFAVDPELIALNLMPVTDVGIAEYNS